MHLLSVPDDVMIIVMRHLSVKELASLSKTCHSLHNLVEEFGWRVYLSLHPLPSRSFAKSTPSWAPRAHVRVNAFIDDQWERSQFVARPLSDRWMTKLQPILAINASRLFLAAGNTIYTYAFGASSNALDDAPSIYQEATYSTSDSTHPKTDITSLACCSDDVDDRTVFVGYASGLVEKLILPPPLSSRQTTYVDASFREAFDGHGDSIIESISTTSDHILSVASSGTVCLRPLSSPETGVQEMIQLNARAWSSLLSSQYAAFGTSSVHPLVIHDVLPSGISPDPYFLLDVPTDYARSTAVYDITSAPMSSPWGASDQVIVSGWYDGQVRVHDLRSSKTSSEPGGSTSSLQPTLAFEDPWSFEPIYSISCGGGAGAHIAAGSARHSVVAFWDVRYAGKGWSVHAPGNDPSPVYSVIVDGPRVFGATQSRGFVLDFGPGVKEETYPAVDVNVASTARWGRHGAGNPRRHGEDDLGKKVGAGFYVTKYSHARSKWTGKSL
ncbi:hypothetical protein EIP91_001223 [Steccherinum ochraceum]|uniref:F-box domain-containing protein n=1 Tax=Steccherinum ochraceum TaxID=92696 RepID=A0A4R0S2Z7_9APHY|nr:hypothetical protein EIP91_001223 [Steccherinum ochraceum]